MQVAHKETRLTHAIINAGESIGMGVSDDPMFFKMLYSSLYSDPRRAAFREPLCNAWDANIDNGMENTPLKITITKTGVTFQDSGKGIPHNKIKDTYLTLGRSTKVDQSAQTGGFGLGCKAPFAYTDHFEVRSACDGVCTIYRMLKVDPSNGGKPGASVIAQFPTTETGLTVTIPFTITDHNRDGNAMCADAPSITWAIMQDIAQGGINAEVNGTLVPVIPLKREPGSWVIMDARSIGLGSNTGIHVRYGSVVYPVHHMDGMDSYRSVARVIEQSFRDSGLTIIFQAPADSIVIPPSRESISTHEITAATMQKMFEDFMEGTQANARQLEAQLYREANAALKSLDRTTTTWNDIATLTPVKLVTAGQGINSCGGLMPGMYVDDFLTLNRVNRIRRGSLATDPEQLTQFQHSRLNKMIELGMLPKHQKGVLSKLVGNLDKASRDWATINNLVIKNALRPIAQKIVKCGGNLKNLFLINHTKSSHNFLVPWNYPSAYGVEYALKYFRGVLILAYTKTDAYSMQADGAAEILKHKNGGSGGSVLVYIVPRQRNKAKEMREYLSKCHQIHLLDLTQAKDEEDGIRRLEAKAKPKAPKAPVTKLPGFPAVSNAITSWTYSDGTRKFEISGRNLKVNAPIRVMEPRYWIDMPTYGRRASDNHLLRGVTTSSHITGQLFYQYQGEGMVVCNNEHRKYVEKMGIPHFTEYLVTKLERSLGRSKQSGRVAGTSVQHLMSEAKLNVDKQSYFMKAMKALMGNPWMCSYYGIKKWKESYHVQQDIQTLDRLVGSLPMSQEYPDLYARVLAIIKHLSTPITNKAALKVLKSMTKVKSFEFINFAYTIGKSQDMSIDASERRYAREFITKLIKK